MDFTSRQRRLFTESDERLRAYERRWRATTSGDLALAWLREAIRIGLDSQELLRILSTVKSSLPPAEFREQADDILSRMDLTRIQLEQVIASGSSELAVEYLSRQTLLNTPREALISLLTIIAQDGRAATRLAEEVIDWHSLYHLSQRGELAVGREAGLTQVAKATSKDALPASKIAELAAIAFGNISLDPVLVMDYARVHRKYHPTPVWGWGLGQSHSAVPEEARKRALAYIVNDPEAAFEYALINGNKWPRTPMGQMAISTMANDASISHKYVKSLKVRPGDFGYDELVRNPS